MQLFRIVNLRKWGFDWGIDNTDGMIYIVKQ